MGFLNRLGRFAGRASPLLSMVNPVAGIALGLGASSLSRRGGGGGGGGDEERRYRNRFESALTGMREGDERTLAGFEEFDPTAGFDEQTKAELDFQDEGFARRYGTHLGNQVGAGRLGTRSGFGVQDTQELIQQGQRERAGIRQRNAAAAQAARGQHLYRTAEFRSGANNRYLDAVGGRFNTLEAQRLQDQAERRQGRAGIIGGLINAGGTMAGAYLGGRRRLPWEKP